MNTLADENALLNAEEKITLQKIARSEDLQGKRALALLALDKGSSQSQAATESGLSPGQVKYSLARFRKDGINMFQEAVTPETKKAAHPQEDSPKKETEEAALKIEKTKKSELNSKKKKEKEPKKSKKKSKKEGKKKDSSKKSGKGKKKKGAKKAKKLK